MSENARVIVIGSTGQLGTELMLRFGARAVGLTHADVRIEDLASVERALSPLIPVCSPCVVINAAAFNLVDAAEEDPATAFAVNDTGAGNVARVAASHGAAVVHFSTDYVFDGEKRTPYVETDPARPLNSYGRSKLAGEERVRAENRRHYVIRVGQLYGLAPPRRRGENFVEMMIRQGGAALDVSRGGRQTPVRAVDDQYVTPTFTRSVARQVEEIIRAAPYGLYHATNGGGCTWVDCAQEIFAVLGMDVKPTPIGASELGRSAPRPAYSIMENAALQRIGLDLMEPWREALRSYLSLRSAAR